MTEQTEQPPFYNARYFYDKFSAIPEELWCMNWYSTGDGRYCVLGHCGVTQDINTPEGTALRLLRKSQAELAGETAGGVSNINDGCMSRYQQPTPRQRILAWLKDAIEAGL